MNSSLHTFLNCTPPALVSPLNLMQNFVCKIVCNNSYFLGTHFKFGFQTVDALNRCHTHMHPDFVRRLCFQSNSDHVDFMRFIKSEISAYYQNLRLDQPEIWETEESLRIEVSIFFNWNMFFHYVKIIFSSISKYGEKVWPLLTTWPWMPTQE